MAKVHIKLENGYQAEVDPIVLDDIEIIDMLAEIEDGNPLAFPRLTKRLLGTDGYKRLCDVIRTEDGRVPSDAFGQCLTEVIRQLGGNNETKK